MSFDSEQNMRAAHRMEAAAQTMERAADRMEDASKRIALMLEDGYGGNGLRLIELLEKVCPN